MSAHGAREKKDQKDHAAHVDGPRVMCEAPATASTDLSECPTGKAGCTRHERLETMHDWQPIETAPKDESHFWAIGRAAGDWTAITQVCWNIWLGDWADHPAPNDLCDKRGIPRAKRVMYQPTHWMPLPTAPADSAVREDHCGYCEGICMCPVDRSIPAPSHPYDVLQRDLRAAAAVAAYQGKFICRCGDEFATARDMYDHLLMVHGDELGDQRPASKETALQERLASLRAAVAALEECAKR